MRIGIVGSGRIGGLVGKLWAQAGHEVCFSARNLEPLELLVRESGPNASLAPIPEAIDFSPVLLLSIPYAAVATFGKRYQPQLAGKIVIETGNPYPNRDGDIANQVRDSREGTGIWSARWLPGARVVRAFNSVWDQTLAREARRTPPRVGVPLASDDPEAMDLTAQLVRDAGFDPVLVGGLATALTFDVGTPVYNTGMSGPELRAALNLPTD